MKYRLDTVYIPGTNYPIVFLLPLWNSQVLRIVIKITLLYNNNNYSFLRDYLKCIQYLKAVYVSRLLVSCLAVVSSDRRLLRTNLEISTSYQCDITNSGNMYLLDATQYILVFCKTSAKVNNNIAMI